MSLKQKTEPDEMKLLNELLTELNHASWSKGWFKWRFKTHGPRCGKACRDGEYSPLPMPQKTDYVEERTTDDMGNTVVYFRFWNSSDDELLKDKRKIILQEENHFEKKEKPACWSAIQKSIGQKVQNLLEANYGEELEIATQENNVLALWNIIKKVCQEANKARAEQFKQDYAKCEFDHRKESVVSWVTRSNELKARAESAAGRPFTEEDLIFFLRGHLHRHTWLPLIPTLYSFLPGNPKIPPHSELLQMMMTVDELGLRDQHQGGKKRQGEETIKTESTCR